ncbi:MAG: antibiotic biosynthesis monooxygenase [Candidatus Aminicenantes bacterium]|nr:antibiotic biosynthesis monooxygenase [Candidatus Aminicenantes bacterium]
MYARLTSAQVKKENIEKFTEIYNTSVVPAAKAQEGYRGSYVLVDHDTGKGIAITLWESKEDALANEESRYYQEQLAKFVTLFTQAPVRELYEVTVMA